MLKFAFKKLDGLKDFYIMSIVSPTSVGQRPLSWVGQLPLMKRTHRQLFDGFLYLHLNLCLSLLFKVFENFGVFPGIVIKIQRSSL